MQTSALALPRHRGLRLATALLCALGLIALALAADSIVSARASAAPSSDGRYTLSGESITIYNLAGAAVLDAGPGTSVVVTVTRLGKDSGELDVATGLIGSRQTLRVLYPGNKIVYPKLGWGSNNEVRVKDDGTFGEGKRDWSTGRRVRIAGNGSGLEAHADLHVSVPKGQQLTLRLAAGPVTVSNVDGDLMVDTGSGAVEASGTRGELKIDTGSGAVEVSNASGGIDIDTGSGSVHLNGTRGDNLKVDTGSGGIEARDIVAQDLSLDTGSGDIEAIGVKADDLRFDTGSGSVEVELTGKARTLDVDTGSGDVTVRVPAEFGADISFESGSGDFETDLPVTVREKDHGSFRGRLRDGTGRIVVETGSGDLRLAANHTR